MVEQRAGPRAARRHGSSSRTGGGCGAATTIGVWRSCARPGAPRARTGARLRSERGTSSGRSRRCTSRRTWTRCGACARAAPELMPEFAAPGLAADTPVCASVAAAAREGVRTAIAAAQRHRRGRAVRLCAVPPPGHHAGPGWLGGLCYLNNAAAAAQALREGGMRPVGDTRPRHPLPERNVGDRRADAGREPPSLHAWPVANSPRSRRTRLGARERLVDFAAIRRTPSIWMR